MVAPSPTGVIVMTVPFTTTVATVSLPLVALTVNPAGVKASATSTSAGSPPTVRETGASVPTARGASVPVTVTEIVWSADPSALVAPTPTEVVPAVTGVRVRMFPSSSALTIPELRDPRLM